MSHITMQSERDENNSIWNCPHREVLVYAETQGYDGDDNEWKWQTENQCGPTEYISAAKDRCIRCKKVFTY